MAAITSCSVDLRVGGKFQPQQPPCSSLCPHSSSSSNSSKLFFSSQLSFAASNNSSLSLRFHQTPLLPRLAKTPNPALVVASAKPQPLKIMISGAPASGKGTQCELITKKYGLVHVAAGDLLRAEIASGSESGKQAKEYMEKGQLVPNEIVVMMVKDRLLQPDAQEKGWLLDGYPRSLSQATALMEFDFKPDIFILLEVPEEILVERVVGRRLDPVAGRIYHLKYSPPENIEIAARLTQRFDDTEEKVKLRLQTHNQNVEAVLSIYEDVTLKKWRIRSKETYQRRKCLARLAVLWQNYWRIERQLQDLLLYSCGIRIGERLHTDLGKIAWLSIP